MDDAEKQEVTVTLIFTTGPGWNDLDAVEWADNFEMVARETFGATRVSAHAEVAL